MRGKSLIYLIAIVSILIVVYFAVNYFYSPQGKMEENSMYKVTSKDGTEIGFIKKGNGPALILVHGTTADHTRWLPIIPYFENQFTVYAVDRRGRGLSGDSPGYSLIKEAEDIAAVAYSIDEPLFILGHSYGGLVALEAALHIDNLKKLILYEPPIPAGLPLYPEGTIEKMQTHIDNNENEAALEVMLREVVEMPDHEFEKYRKLPVYQRRIELAPTIPREITVELDFDFIPERYNNFNIPTLLLLGGDSPEIFHKITNLLNEVLPNSSIISMDGQQHIAMDTNTELFTQVVKKFLSN
jgi:pimeloyl-ACP methyl ester carboxylesterase